ncbi:MAG: hypothetical protein ACK4TI_04680 [Nitrososphaerales archaeon]
MTSKLIMHPYPPSTHMPFEIVCGNCGETLYWGMDLTSPREVLKIKRSICYKCGVKLSTDYTLEILRYEAYAPAIKRVGVKHQKADESE